MTIQKKSGRKSLNLTVGDFVVVQEEQPQRDVDRVVLRFLIVVTAGTVENEIIVGGHALDTNTQLLTEGRGN